jgi:hypothetical protein
MIGVCCKENEKDIVREFPELFKTPWQLYEEEHLNITGGSQLRNVFVHQDGVQVPIYGNALVRRFHFGVSEYLYGNHPLFELTKCLYQMKQKPYLLGSIFRLCGYCWAFLRREPREVPAEVVAYMRSEQKKRL